MQTSQTNPIERILNFWFGNRINAEIPNSDRTHIWFSDDDDNIALLKEQLGIDLQAAQQGTYRHWEESAYGSLALIILLNIIPKRIYPNQKIAYQNDASAIRICQQGIARELDHQLALVERVFYYMPLLQAENLTIQQQSVELYQRLVDYSLKETKLFYQTFLALALHHLEIIEQFGRFPERNAALGRSMTSAELAYLHI